MASPPQAKETRTKTSGSTAAPPDMPPSCLRDSVAPAFESTKPPLRVSAGTDGGESDGPRRTTLSLVGTSTSSLLSTNDGSPTGHGAGEAAPPLVSKRAAPQAHDSERKEGATDGCRRGSCASDDKEPAERFMSSLRSLRQSFSHPSGVLELVRSYSDVKGTKVADADSSEDSAMRRAGSYRSLVLGIILSAGASAILSLVNVIIKRLESVSSLEVLTFMAFGVFIGILPAASEEAQPFGPSGAQPLLIARTILSLGSAGLRLSSLWYLSIADCSIITSLTPLMVVVMASLFLSEPCHWTQGAAVALSLLGITFVVKPPFLVSGSSFTDTQYIGMAYGFSHTVLNGITTVCIRATKGVSRSVVVFHYGCLSMLLVSVVAIVSGNLKIFYDGSQIGYLLLISHLTFAVQMFLTKALEAEDAAVVTIVKTSSDVIFGFVMQAVFMNMFPDWFSAFGGFLVVLGVVLTGLRKVVASAPPASKFKRRFQFLL